MQIIVAGSGFYSAVVYRSGESEGFCRLLLSSFLHTDQQFFMHDVVWRVLIGLSEKPYSRAINCSPKTVSNTSRFSLLR